MSKTILVPLDGSRLAERALPFAARLARAYHARLLLARASMHASDVLLLDAQAMRVAHVREVVEEKTAEAELADVAERVRANAVAADTCVRRGEPARVILETARERRAIVIAMTTHGRSGLGRWFYGSVADEVLRHAEAPALLVPAGCDLTWPEDRPLRILLPLDGSAVAEEVLGPGADLADALGAHLLLLRVVEAHSGASPTGYGHTSSARGPEATRARRYLKRIATKLRMRMGRVDLDVVTGSPSSTIAEVATDRGVDAIAMGTHGRGGLARLTLGSVAAATVMRATVPLLLVRPRAVRQRTFRAEAESRGAAVSVTLSAEELDLVQRGLEGLLVPEREPRLAASALTLLARLNRAAE